MTQRNTSYSREGGYIYVDYVGTKILSHHTTMDKLLSFIHMPVAVRLSDWMHIFATRQFSEADLDKWLSAYRDDIGRDINYVIHRIIAYQKHLTVELIEQHLSVFIRVRQHMTFFIMYNDDMYKYRLKNGFIDEFTSMMKRYEALIQ